MEGTTANGGNLGLVQRGRYLAESRVVDMIGRLHVDLFLHDTFLLNGVDVKIRLVRSKDAFSLMADGQNPDYKVRIVEAILFARKAVLSPTVQMAHIKALASTRYDPWTARSTPYHKAPCPTRTRTSSSERYQHDSSCGVSTMTPTTGIMLKTHSTPRTTP